MTGRKPRFESFQSLFHELNDGVCTVHPGLSTYKFDIVWGIEDRWVVGSPISGVFFYDGAAWTPAPFELGTLVAVTGSGPEDVWYSGSGVLLHETW